MTRANIALAEQYQHELDRGASLDELDSHYSNIGFVTEERIIQREHERLVAIAASGEVTEARAVEHRRRDKLARFQQVYGDEIEANRLQSEEYARC